MATLADNRNVLELISGAILSAGSTPGDDVLIYVDAAANEFTIDGEKYAVCSSREPLTSSELVDYYISLVDEFPALGWIEDPANENDIDSWCRLREVLPSTVKLVGDDLTCTNLALLGEAIGVVDSVIVKPNQIGTFTESKHFTERAQKSGLSPILSDRSGEIWDPTLAAFGVGIGITQAKIIGLYHDGLYHFNEYLRISEIDE